MANLSTVQEAHLKAFENDYQILKTAEATLEATLREQLSVELLGLRIAASQAGNRCKAAGVPISRLGEKGRRGMNTRNWNTITEFLALTENFSLETAEDLVPKIIRYEFVPENEDKEIWTDRLRVHMDGAEYEAWKAGEGKKRFRGDAADRDLGEYIITADGGVGIRAQGVHDSSTVNTYDLAVGGWLQGPGKAEAEAWIRDNVSLTVKENN